MYSLEDVTKKPKGIVKKLYSIFLPEFYKRDLDNPVSITIAIAKTLSSYIYNGLAIYGAYCLIF
jgi:hypothetical protein